MDRSEEASTRPSPEQYQPRLTLWAHTWRMLVCLLISGLLLLVVVVEGPERVPAWKWLLDLTLGAAGFVLVSWRRRAPFAVAVLLTLATAVSASVAGPATLAAVSLATRRRLGEIAAVSVLMVLCAHLFYRYFPLPTAEPVWIDVASNIGFTIATMALGMFIGSRRELMWTLRERARRAESEQELRMARAREAERARIAREMHDVLAHRISQISMHAGALAFREDLDAPGMRESAGIIQAKAHEALTDLRDVLGVLRDPGSGALQDRPQPSLADLPDLLADARRAGMAVTYEEHLSDPPSVPLVVGRTVYRIVQEGLTNARKHAPGALLAVQVSGGPDSGVDVVLRNPLGFDSVPAAPGAGLGLIGLRERTELRGGRLEHRRDGAAFVLHAWIPWAS